MVERRALMTADSWVEPMVDSKAVKRAG